MRPTDKHYSQRANPSLSLFVFINAFQNAQNLCKVFLSAPLITAFARRSELRRSKTARSVGELRSRTRHLECDGFSAMLRLDIAKPHLPLKLIWCCSFPKSYKTYECELCLKSASGQTFATGHLS